MNTEMKLRKFYLRYFPPGLTILYSQSGYELSKNIELINFNEESNIETYLHSLQLSEPILTAARKSQLEDILKKIQTKLKEPEKDYFYLENVVEAHLLPLTNVSFNKLGSQFITGSYDRTCKLWNTDTADLCREYTGHDGVVYCVSFNNPYGTKILTGSFDKTAKVWDSESGQLCYTLIGHTAEIVSSQFSPSCNLIATGCMNGLVKIWDTETGKCLGTLTEHTGAIVAANFSNCQKYLLTGSFDSTAIVYDAHELKPVRQLSGHAAEISQANFNWTTTQVLTGSIDGTARVWDMGSGRQMAVIQNPNEDPILDAKFNLVPNYFAVCGERGYAALYNSATFELHKTLSGHEDEVSLITFNPKGSRLLTCSSDKTARLWNVDDGKCYQVLVGHTDEIFSAAFNYDGDVIITGKNQTLMVAVLVLMRSK